MAYDRVALEREVAKITANEIDHNIDHHRRVYFLARKIAEAEKLVFDDDVLHASCLMHDIGYTDPRSSGDLTCHIDFGVEIASKILPNMGFPKEKMAAALECIRMHDDSKPWAIHEGRYAQTDITEAKLLQDADCVEGFGILGMFRIAGYNQKIGSAFYKPELPFNYESRSKSTIHNFHYHLENKSRINYKSSEQIMAARGAEMIRTYGVLLDELELKR